MTERVDDEERSLAPVVLAPVVPLRTTIPEPQAAITRESSHEPPFTAFDRRELSEILKLYGRMVAAGEWRDYAIDTLKDRAVFSVFRRSSEMPIYRIEKNPKLARKQGAYAVISQTGMILKRGSDLARVIRVLDKTFKLVDA